MKITATIGILEGLVSAVDGVDDAICVPGDDLRGVFLQVGWNVCLGASLLVDTHDPLAAAVLRVRYGGARDQGIRPTCLAFALSDAHAAERPPHARLSVDFLYYHALRRMRPLHGDNGVDLSEALAALDQDGQPLETVWPYVAALPKDRTNWRPPSTAAIFCAKGTAIGSTVEAVCGALDRNQSAVLVFLPTEAFYYADRAGIMPVTKHDPALPQLHAVVAVGYGHHAGSRSLLVRNSWGSGWGMQGHAWLPEEYLASRLSSVTFIEAR